MFGHIDINDRIYLIQILRKYLGYLTQKLKDLYYNHLVLIKCVYKEKLEILPNDEKNIGKF